MPTRIWFGGSDGVPMACRRNPSTIRMRVKPVIMISTDGPSVISVNRPSRPMVVPGSPPGAGTWTLTVDGSSAAPAGTASASRRSTAPASTARRTRGRIRGEDVMEARDESS